MVLLQSLTVWWKCCVIPVLPVEVCLGMTRRPTYSWCLQISVPDIDASIDLHDMTDCTRNASLTLMVVFEYITTKRELLSLNTIQNTMVTVRVFLKVLIVIKHLQ